MTNDDSSLKSPQADVADGTEADHEPAEPRTDG